jgi:hypothetical protein
VYALKLEAGARFCAQDNEKGAPSEGGANPVGLVLTVRRTRVQRRMYFARRKIDAFALSLVRNQSIQ